MRPINFRRIAPSQAIADNVDNPTDYTPVIDTWFTVGSRKVRFDALKLVSSGVQFSPIVGFEISLVGDPASPVCRG